MSEALRKAATAALEFLLDGNFVYPTSLRTDLEAALAEPEKSEPVCNPHPKAPHGFNRNSSHSAGRYVCDCESWDPYEAGYRQGFQDGQKFEEEVSWPVCDCCEAPPRREPLSDEQIQAIRAECANTPPDKASTAYGWAINFARAIEQAHGITGEKT